MLPERHVTVKKQSDVILHVDINDILDRVDGYIVLVRIGRAVQSVIQGQYLILVLFSTEYEPEKPVFVFRVCFCHISLSCVTGNFSISLYRDTSSQDISISHPPQPVIELISYKHKPSSKLSKHPLPVILPFSLPHLPYPYYPTPLPKTQ